MCGARLLAGVASSGLVRSLIIASWPAMRQSIVRSRLIPRFLKIGLISLSAFLLCMGGGCATPLATGGALSLKRSQTTEQDGSKSDRWMLSFDLLSSAIPMLSGPLSYFGVKVGERDQVPVTLPESAAVEDVGSQKPR